jgi:ribosomal protein L37AE/L43A
MMERGAAKEAIDRDGSRICRLCGGEYAFIHVEVIGGIEIYTCESCLEKAARSNFIWLCLQCRRVYLKPKKLVIEQAGDMELRAYYLRYMNEQVIQGIDRCASCESEDAFLTDLVVA